jgi:hypothetical protein
MLEGGTVDFSDFPNLERIEINGINIKPPITKLILKNCANLTELICYYTNLSDFDFLKELPNPEKLRVLDIRSNNFPHHDLTIFERFINLTDLKIGNLTYHDKQNGKYNRFQGSPKTLTTKLKSLNCFDFENTMVFN